ncbi:MAG TPA: hypothetical protein VGB94_10345 [Acidobacteriaceae bacterium]
MIATAVLAAGFVSFAMAPAAQAQASRRHHETTVSRKYRAARLVEDTYSRKVEAAFGGGFMRFQPGSTLRRANQVDWAASGAYYYTPAYGLVGDVRGHYGNVSLPNFTTINGNFSPNNGVYHPLITEYTFMVGPQWRFYRREKYAISANVQGGMALGNFDGGTHGIPAEQLGMWPTGHTFAGAASVNLDYNIYPNFALRLQPTYVFTHFGGTSQVNKGGVNAQVVYRFGKK